MSFVVYPSYAVDFWHSSTVFANQGQCSALFSFDSGMEEIKNLQVTVSAVNKSGKKVASGILEIQEFGGSTADRYSQAFLEGEELCADDLTIVVSKATAIINGKQVDLLKTKMLSARNFKPFKIHLGK
jgi:hypothetical protein